MQIPSYAGYCLLAVAGCAGLYLFANRQLFQPMKYPEGWWEVRDEIGAEDVWIEPAGGGRIHGWWREVSGSRLVTLYLHGNAGNVSHRASHIAAISGAGSSVLVIDYRGYGRSEGRPSESGLYADAGAAYRYLRERGFEAGQIIVHGESLGTSVAVDLAARERVAGVILEAPFTSAGDVAHRVIPYLGRLLIRSFDTKAKIGRLRWPLMVIHGEQDEVVSFQMGRALFDAAPEPKQFWAVPGAGHNDLVESGAGRYQEHLVRFYRTLAAK